MNARKSTYTTKQGRAIIACLKENENEHLTAPQIAKLFSVGTAAIGRATIFRQLDKMARQGIIRKYLLDGNTGACYQYIGDNCGDGDHLHLKCDVCGNVIHMDGKALPRMAKGILKGYNFEVDAGKTVIYGKCHTCSGKVSI